ncbi:MAG: alpha-N-acetylglucosaminidase C-terminal domain-containing protein, partial [Chitinophagaceae bacterium]
KYTELNKSYVLMDEADRLLLSHPDNRLQRWVDYAKAFGGTPSEKHYYEEDARRIITTWGPGVGDYSARMWAGLISSYYVQRMKHYYGAQKDHNEFNVAAWEENWVENGPSKISTPNKDPIAIAKEMIGMN